MVTKEAHPNFVLAVAEHPWPSTSGGQLRTAAIANVLAELGTLTVVSLNMPDTPAELRGPLARYWSRRGSQALRALDFTTGLVGGNHISLQRAISAGVPEGFGVLLERMRPSVVVLGRPFFGPFVTRAVSSGACTIVDPDESLVRVSRSILRSHATLRARGRAFADLLTAGRMERRDFGVAHQVWAGSTIEAAGLRRAAAGVPIHIVPNVAIRIPDVVPAPGPVIKVAFVGSYRHPPNEEAAMELMTSIIPAVRAAGGPDELILIGRDPSERMRRAADAAGNVTITGEVPDTNVPLRDAGALVAPVRSGGGTRLKVLEAAAAGIPIISTAFGIDGLALRAGRDVLVAETPAEFAAALRRLRDEPGLTTTLAEGARAFVQEHHSPAALRQRIGEALAACP